MFRLKAEATGVEVEAAAGRERASRASHANGARRRSGARESVSGSPRGEAPRMISDELQRQGGQIDALDGCGPGGAWLDRRRFGQRAGADEIAGSQRLGVMVL